MTESVFQGLRGAFTLSALVCLCSGPLEAAPSEKVTEGLVREGEAEFSLASESSRTHRLPAADRWREVAVEQLGIDIVLEVANPPRRIDNPFDRYGTEYLLLEPSSDPVDIQVHGREAAAPAGHYRFSVQVLGRAIRRIESVRAESLAGEHYAAGGAENFRQALAQLETAQRLWNVLEQPRRQNRAVHAMAVLARLMDSPREALDLGMLASSRWQELGEEYWAGVAQNEIGLAYWQLDELEAARGSFILATQARGLESPFGRIQAQANLCLLDLVAGDLVAGAACYEKLLPHLEPLRSLELESAVRTSVGRAWDLLGEPARAAGHYRSAIEAQELAGDVVGLGKSLNNLAALQRKLGQVDVALETYGKALEIFRRTERRKWQARVLGNLGEAYLQLGELGAARSFTEQALRLRRDIGDVPGEARAVSQLASLAQRGGRDDLALAQYRRALDLWRDSGRRREQASTLAAMARPLKSSGEPAAALAVLREAAKRQKELGDVAGEAKSLCRWAEILVETGTLEGIAERLERALGLASDAGDPLLQAQCEITQAQALILRGEDFEAASRSQQAAQGRLDRLRLSIHQPRLRRIFSSVQDRSQDVAIELAMGVHRQKPAAGHDRRALELADLSRARSLVELLRESRVDLLGQAPAPLRQSWQALRRRLAAKDERLAGQASPTIRERLEADRLEIRRRLDLLEGEIRLQNPGWQRLMAPSALSVPEMQELLADDPGHGRDEHRECGHGDDQDCGNDHGDDVMVLYFQLGDRQSFLWALTSTRLTSHELPPRRQIVDWTRRWHEQLAGRTDSAASSPLGTEHISPSDHSLDEELGVSLLGPLAERLLGQRLVIVADGALHFLPFAALISPATGRPLVVDHPISFVASLGALAVERETRGARPQARADVAIVADPIFDSGDPRLAGEAVERALSGPSLDGADSHRPTWPRLPFSRREAEAIAELAPEGSEPLMAFGLDANRQLITDGNLETYRFLHFATHGVFDSERPAESGLLLSTLDGDGLPRSGRLRLDDLYGLRLSAELVVLSGCRSALGQEIEGEGLVGLAQGFQYAGAARLMASLWPVDDRATAALMAAFYRALWHKNLSPPAALQAAQQEIRLKRRWRNPYYWAGFVLLGEWR